jgi:transposase
MYRLISRDVKLAAIRLHDHGVLTLNEILACCGFSLRTWYRIKAHLHTTGDVVGPPRAFRGRIRSLDHDDVQYLLELIRHNPDLFLDELLDLLKTNHFISVHYTTIHAELLRLNVSRKKLQRIAIERDEDKRALFVTRVAQYSPEEIAFIDEVSKDERTMSRRYGRSKKGKQASKKQPFVRGRRTSTVGLLSLDGFVCSKTVEGSFTKVEFLS